MTDGVFAIVMTLMVFEIRISDATSLPLATALAVLWPKFFAYAVAFLQLGIYWSGQRNQFGFIVREDHTLRWICLGFLALVSLIPFSTQVLGDRRDEPLAIALYAGNLVLVGLVLFAQWVYVTRARLVRADIGPAVVVTGYRRTLTAPILYGVTIVLALVVPTAALIALAVVPLLYLVPRTIDAIWFVRR